MKTKWLGLMSALALMTGILVAGATPAGAWNNVRIVRTGQSIQAAINAVGPGGTVIVQRGTYHEQLVITQGVNLVARGATLAPPAANGAPSACSAPDPNDDGICIAGDFTIDPDTGAATINHYVRGVRISGLTVTGFTGSGIVQYAGEGSRFVGNVAKNNGEYGIAAFNSTGTTELFNNATGSAEAGFYIGDSPQANATLLGNTSTNNLFGFFVRDAERGTIAANSARDNCVGILFLADAPGPDGAFAATANNISHNTKACPASDDGPAASGIGMFIFGAHDVKIRANWIVGNTPSGPTLTSGGVVVATGMGGTAPLSNVVTRNVILHNGTDINWDGTGTGNVLQPNLCAVSDPSGLCHAH